MDKKLIKKNLEKIIINISSLNRLERIELLNEYADNIHFKKILSIIYYIEMSE